MRAVERLRIGAFSGYCSGELPITHLLVLQCHLDLVTVHGTVAPKSFDYPRPEPFFAPFAVSTVDRALGPKLLLW